MSETGKAIFLSYASQDTGAAKRICDSLRQAGLEVWFDQDEFRGGDEWDREIKQQIRECALFVPVISADTQARPEGYSLEWRRRGAACRPAELRAVVSAWQGLSSP